MTTTPPIKRISLELLHNVLSVQSKSGDHKRMNRFIRKFCRKHGFEFWEDNGNVYIVKGEADLYPCMIAHGDTVHSVIDNFVVIHNREKGYFHGINKSKVIPAGTGGIQYAHYANAGVGGDDKVGVAIVLHCLLTFPVMKAVIFRDEETGCQGSAVADMSFFDDCAFVGEVDRKGHDDFVNFIGGKRLFSQNFRDAVTPYLEAYKFRETTGLTTDVGQLRKNGLAIACFNMSAGYHAPHTPAEIVNIAHVQNCVGLVEDIVGNLSTEQWVISDEDLKSTYSYWPGQNAYRNQTTPRPYTPPTTTTTLPPKTIALPRTFTEVSGKPVIDKDITWDDIRDSFMEICPGCNSSDGIVYDWNNEDDYCMICGLYTADITQKETANA